MKKGTSTQPHAEFITGEHRAATATTRRGVKRRTLGAVSAKAGILACSIAALLTQTASAITWVGNTSVNWNNAANWGGTLPTLGGDAFVFAAAGSAGTVLNNDISGQTINSLTINSGAPAWTLGGNAITLAGGVTNSSTSLLTLNFDIATTAVRIFTMTAGGGNITLGGVISGSGGGVTLAGGAGTLTLSGNNNYSGNTTIDTGTTLNINSATAIGNGTLVASGTAILDNTSAAAITLTNNNNINLSGGSLTFTGTKDLNFGTGVVTISGANRTITTTAGTLTIGSINAATTSLTFTKAGSGGTLIITGAAGANLQGQISLSGTVGVGNNTSLGTGNILLNTGLVFQAVNNDVTMANTGTFQSFTISGSQNLTFSNKLTGTTGSSRTLTSSLATGKTLTLGAVDINADTGATARTLTIAGTGNTIIGATANGTGTTTANGLTITNTGVTTLNAANSYTGTTTVTAGALRLSNANALPGGVSTAGGTSALLFNGTGSAGGLIALTSLSGDFTRSIGTTAPTATQVGWSSGGTGGFSAFGGDRSVNFGGAGAGITWSSTGGVLGGGLILSDSAADSTITVVNPIALNGATRTFIVNNGTPVVDAIVSGAITGTGSAIIKTGPGTLALTATNTYGSLSVSGTTFTTISDGTLQIGNGSTTGSLTTSVLGVEIQNDATLAFNRSNALTMQYVIKGTGAVNQIGAGTTTLSGTNTYTGPTTITAGALSVGLASNLGAAGSNLVFDGGTLQITGTALTSITSLGRTVSFNAGKTVGFDINSAANTFTVGQVLNQTTGGLTKLGTGTLVLNQANTYTGTTALSAGVLDVGTISNGSLGSGGLAFSNSAVLQGNGTFARTFSGSSTAGAGQITGTTGGFAAKGGTLTVNFGGSGNQITISNGNFRFGTNFVFGSASADSKVVVVNPLDLNLLTRTFTVNSGVGGDSAELQGVISSSDPADGIIKAGPGLLVFTAASTYTGSTTINSGTLQLGSGGTTGSIGATSGITNNGTLALNRSNTLAISANISGTGVVNQIGTGITNLSGTNIYNGGTNVTTGTLTYLNTNAKPASGTTTVAAGATLGLGVATSGSFFTSADVDSLFTGTLGNVTNDATSRVGIDTTAGNFTYATSVSATTRGLTKLGANTLSLSGANSYTGPTTVVSGILRLDNATALPGGIATGTGTSNLVMGGGILGLTAASGDFTRAIGTGASQVTWITGTVSGFAAFGGDRTVNFGGLVTPSTVTWSDSGGVIGTGLILSDSTADSTITIANPISLSNASSNRPVTVNDGTAAVDAIFAGVISSQTTANNGTRLIKNGTGTLALTAANTYVSGSGVSFPGTTITAGTLQLGNGGTTGSISGLTGTGINSDISISTGATLAFNRSNALTVSNTIIGAGAVRQIGGGTTTLSGTNTYTGATTVTAGTLAISGSINNTVSVSVSGGTLLLGASQVVNNSASVTLDNATLSAGGNSEFVGASSATATAAGLGAFTLSSNSTIDFGGGTSTLWFSGITSLTGTLNIINWSGDAVLGGGDDQLRFTADPSAFLSQISFGGSPGAGQIFFNNGGNSYYEIVPVPEPATTAAIGAAALLGLIGFRERRRVLAALRRCNG